MRSIFFRNRYSGIVIKKLGILFLSVLLSLSVFSEGKPLSDSLLAKIEKTNSQREKIFLYNELAVYYWYNRPSKTIEYGKKALELAEELENDSLIINSRINLGIGYSYIADYKNAMNQFIQSLSLSDKINSKSGVSNSLSNIAIIFDYLGNYEKAEAFYVKSIKISKEIKDGKGTIGGLNNLGILYSKTKKYKKALDCYNEALVLEKVLKDKQMIAITLSNIGDVYEANGEVDKALEYFNNSLSAGKELKNNTLVIASMINIGKIYFSKNNYTLALEYYQKSLSLSTEFGFISFTTDIYKYISELYEKLNNSNKALEYFKKYDSLKSTALSKESSSKIAELQIKYETDAKEIENKLLQKENNYQRGLRNFLLIITTLVLIVAFLFFRGYLHKKNAARVLFEKNKIITEQKEQLQLSMNKLQQSEEMYRSLITTSPDGIFITDLNAKIQYVSPYFLQILGYADREDLIGKNATVFITEKDNSKTLEYFKQVTEEKYTNAIEFVLVRYDGKLVEVEANGGVLRNPEGRISKLFFMVRDVTVRKKIENEHSAQQEMIFTQKQEISKLELLKKEQENYMLRGDLEYKNKELASKAMYIIQNNELIDSIVEKLKLLEMKADENERISSGEIRALVNNLRSTIRRDSWKEFETHFTQVHSDFYSNLHTRFPELTANEKKLCAFLRLNLSTKEISEITSKSIHSLNVARTRLRQKLGMTNTDDNLSAFLSQF